MRLSGEAAAQRCHGLGGTCESKARCERKNYVWSSICVSAPPGKEEKLSVVLVLARPWMVFRAALLSPREWVQLWAGGEAAGWDPAAGGTPKLSQPRIPPCLLKATGCLSVALMALPCLCCQPCSMFTAICRATSGGVPSLPETSGRLAS